MPISDVDALKTDEWHRMIDVNIKGVLNTTAATLPYLQRQKSGHIFNTSSIAGRKVFPGLSVYCATKFAVAAFSDGLRMEVAKKHNIRVTCIQPGAVESESVRMIYGHDHSSLAIRLGRHGVPIKPSTQRKAAPELVAGVENNGVVRTDGSA